jgi:hypothetical protein
MRRRCRARCLEWRFGRGLGVHGGLFLRKEHADRGRAKMWFECGIDLKGVGIWVGDCGEWVGWIRVVWGGGVVGESAVFYRHEWTKTGLRFSHSVRFFSCACSCSRYTPKKRLYQVAEHIVEEVKLCFHNVSFSCENALSKCGAKYFFAELGESLWKLCQTMVLRNWARLSIVWEAYFLWSYSWGVR